MTAIPPGTSVRLVNQPGITGEVRECHGPPPLIYVVELDNGGYASYRADRLEIIPKGNPMTNEPQITQVTFAVGENDWTATYDGSTMTVECGSLELSIGLHESDWVQRAKSLVKVLSDWSRKGGA